MPERSKQTRKTCLSQNMCCSYGGMNFDHFPLQNKSFFFPMLLLDEFGIVLSQNDKEGLLLEFSISMTTNYTKIARSTRHTSAYFLVTARVREKVLTDVRRILL